MKALVLLKIFVVVLTLAIIGAFSFVIVKITEKPVQIKHKVSEIVAPAVPVTVSGLSFGETVKEMVACAPYVCVLTEQTNGARVLVLDVQKGTVIQTIELKQP